jgi:hypothetical protein
MSGPSPGVPISFLLKASPPCGPLESPGGTVLMMMGCGASKVSGSVAPPSGAAGSRYSVMALAGGAWGWAGSSACGSCSP